MSEHPRFDDYLLEELRNPAEAREYLDVALEMYEEDGDLAGFLLALKRVAEASGLAEADKYLPTEGHPRFGEIMTMLHDLGFRLSVERVARTA